MPKYVKLPDGGLFPLREGEDPTDALAEARRLYPQAFGATPEPEAQPQSGFTPALKAGFSGLQSAGAALAGRTGLMDPERAARIMEEEKTYQARTFKPTEDWGLTKGLELLGGSVPYMVAPVAAAGAAAALPFTGAAATAAGLSATGLASLAQFTGTNLQRQVEEGKRLQETELGSAFAAAAPQAAKFL